MIIKLRSRADGAHITESVFVGPDKDHLALAGTLRFDLAEWQHFGAALLMGAGNVGSMDIQIVTEGDDEVVRAFACDD